jgi:superfamily I DNA/RNA helicase
MHRAKGLEFKVVFVVDASHDYLPLPVALRSLKDPGDRQDAIEKEKHLLYVSITRARDEVFISWMGKVCEFLKKPRAAKVVALAKR